MISADESIMIFTSKREETTGGKIDHFNYQYFEDIYISYKNKDNKWGQAANIRKPINTDDHDATVGISPDGQQILIYYGNINNGDIFTQ